MPGSPAGTAVNIRKLAGYNSREVFFFEPENAGLGDGAYVMRREPAGNVTETSLAAEGELLRLLHGVACV